MKRLYIEQLVQMENERILLKGWVHKIKNFGKLAFVLLRDKTGIVQLVVNDEEIIKELKLEMCIEVSGKAVKNEKAFTGVEVQVEGINIISKTYYDLLPFSINERKVNAALETELDYRYISLRRPDRRGAFKIQEEIVQTFRSFLRDKGFSEIHTPKIIASGTEGGSEMFTVSYFDKRAFLAQSPQFYKQMMVGAGFEAVFEVGHAYRAELHNTWRHLNEYVSLDVEMAFIEDENDLMNLEESFIKSLFEQLKQNCSRELKMYGAELPIIDKIPRIPLEEAQRILLDKYNKKSPVGNIDAEGEQLFSEYVKETYGSDFVFLTEYPVAKRPMYTMPMGDGKTKSFDLIYKGLEITTGGQRIHDYEMLKKNIEKFGLVPENFGFYLDSFKYGMPPHGGFAIGLERLTMKILNFDNIRQTTLLPRDINRIKP